MSSCTVSWQILILLEFWFTFNAGESLEEFDIQMLEVDLTRCNCGALFAPNVGVSLDFDKEFVGINEILLRTCEEFNRLGVSRSTSSECT